MSWAEWINISSRNQIALKIKTVIDEETSDETFCNNGDAVDMDRDMNFLMNDFLFYGQIKGKSPTCSTKWRGSSGGASLKLQMKLLLITKMQWKKV